MLERSIPLLREESRDGERGVIQRDFQLRGASLKEVIPDSFPSQNIR